MLQFELLATQHSQPIALRTRLTSTLAAAALGPANPFAQGLRCPAGDRHHGPNGDIVRDANRPRRLSATCGGESAAWLLTIGVVIGPDPELPHIFCDSDRVLLVHLAHRSIMAHERFWTQAIPPRGGDAKPPVRRAICRTAGLSGLDRADVSSSTRPQTYSASLPASDCLRSYADMSEVER